MTHAIPGASADMIAETVAAPLEQAINGVEDMLYMRSGSSSATGSLTIASRSPSAPNADIAAINVHNRVQSALPHLPEEVRRQGVTVAKRSSSFLMIISFDFAGRRATTICSSRTTRRST